MAERQSCFVKLKDWVKESGLKIPDKRLKEFAHILDQKRADLLTRGAFSDEVEKLVQEDIEKFAAKKRAVDTMELAGRERSVRAIQDKSFGGTLVENFRYWVGGIAIKVGDSVNIDPAKLTGVVKSELLSIWRRGIEPYKDLVSSGKLNREIYQELDAIQKGLPAGGSGSKVALEIANTIHLVQTAILERKKAYNPFMEKADEYLIKRFHSREKVAAVDESEWVADAMKAFGKRSFPDLSPAEKAEIFRGIYQRITHGTYGSLMHDAGADAYVPIKGQGGNIHKRMSRQRHLVAEDWQAAYEYNQKYGFGTVEETITRVIDNASRDIALLEKFGANPKARYQAVYDRVHARASHSERLELERSKKSLDRLFDTATGVLDSPAHTQLARWGQGWQTVQYMSKMGAATLRSLPDLAVASGMIRGLNGQTVFANAAEIVGEYVRFFKDTEARKVALEDVWMFSQSALRNMAREFGHPGQGAGKLAKTAELYGTMTLLGRHVESMRAAVGTVVSRQLARQADVAYANLSPRWKNGLLRYGIKEAEWDILRLSVQDWGALDSGAPMKRLTMMNVDGVNELPAEAVENYLRKSGQLEGEKVSAETAELGRRQLAYKIGALINDHADYGSTTPGTRQRAFMYMGTDINDPAGLALRFIWQFKSAGLTTFDAYRRIYHSGDGPKGDLAGVAQTFAMSLFFWTMGEYAYQASTGKKPEHPGNPDFIRRAVVGSGAGGMFADVLLGEADRNGVTSMVGAMAKSAVGPGISSAFEGVAIGAQYAKSGFNAATGQRGNKAPNSDLARWALSNTPGQNLFYLRGALNFYVTNGLREFLDRGYLANLERGTRQTPGLIDDRQDYINFPWGQWRPTQSPRLLGN